MMVWVIFFLFLIVAGGATALIFDWRPFAKEEIATLPPASTVGLGGEAALVNDLAVAEGAIWAATEGGLVRWTADGLWLRFSGPDIGFPDDWVQTLAVAPDGSLWLGAGGVSHIQLVDENVLYLQYFDRDDNLGMARVRHLWVADDGTVWAGGPADRESPISQYNGDQWQFEGVSPPLEEAAGMGINLDIWTVLFTEADQAWIGLVEDGILNWDGQRWRHWGENEGVGGRSLSDARIRALIEDKAGVIWAAASDRGLLRYQSESEKWEVVSNPALSLPVTAVAQFVDGPLWVAGNDWVARSDDGGLSWTKVATSQDGLGDDIGSIAQDENGLVWVGSYGGGVSVYRGGVWHRFQPVR